MGKLGKYVVYWDGGGTNTHHYFDTFEEAEGYCRNTSNTPKIAYVLYTSRIEHEKAANTVLNILKAEQTND